MLPVRRQIPLVGKRLTHGWVGVRKQCYFIIMLHFIYRNITILITAQVKQHYLLCHYAMLDIHYCRRKTTLLTKKMKDQVTLALVLAIYTKQ